MPFLNADLIAGELGDKPGTAVRILVVDDEPRLRSSLACCSRARIERSTSARPAARRSRRWPARNMTSCFWI